MTTKLEIFNAAVTRVGVVGDIASEDEDSSSARACRGVYPLALSYVLESFDWGFASEWGALALSDDPAPAPWEFIYAVPFSALKIREVMRENTYEAAIPYDIFINSEGTGRVIVTNVAEARARYTKKINDPTVLSSMAADAVATKMAVDVASVLRGSRPPLGLRSAFRQQLRAAQLSDAKEQRPFVQRSIPKGIESRHSGGFPYLSYVDPREIR